MMGRDTQVQYVGTRHTLEVGEKAEENKPMRNKRRKWNQENRIERKKSTLLTS